MRVSAGQHQGGCHLVAGARHTHQRSPKWTRCRRAPALRAVALDDLTLEAEELGVSFSPIHEDLGADVAGMDLSGGISDAEGALVKKALDRYLLLRFRQQTLEPADETKFLSHLPHDEGSIKNKTAQSVMQLKIPGHPWIGVVPARMDLEDHHGISTQWTPGTGTFYRSIPPWHMDTSHSECSPKYSYMYMKVVPPEKPVTVFASTAKAYALLSDEQKKVASKLQVRNYTLKSQLEVLGAPDTEFVLSESGVRFADPAAREARAIRTTDEGESYLQDDLLPLVIEEKGTGVRSFHITPYKLHSFEGMTTEESHEFLESVLKPVTSEPWAADWQPDDVLVWKNRQIVHAVPPTKTYQGPRLFHLVFWPSNDPVMPVQGE